MSDGEIRRAVDHGEIAIRPFDPEAVQPASVDLRLGPDFRVYDSHSHSVIDPLESQEGLTRVIMKRGEGEFFVLHPGEFVLGTTVEQIELPDTILARLEGKSSLARLGLLVHVTGGFIDPGFEGELTLEMSNVNQLPIKLRPKMKIAQISFDRMACASVRPYGHRQLGSKYKGQRGPTASLYHQNP